MAGPWEKYGGGQAVGPDPYKVEDQNIQREAAARAAAAAERSAAAQEHSNLNSDRSYENTVSNQRVNQALAMAQDYNANPEVKVYNSILPTYAAALSSPNTPAGDLGMVFAVAKIMAADGSAVREGEVATAENTQRWVDQIQAQYGKQVNGDGTFTDAARQQIREAMRQKMAFLNKAYIAQRVRYKEQAERAGLNPLDVVGQHTGIPFQKAEEAFTGHLTPKADYRGNVIPQTPQLSPQARGTGMGTTQTEIANGGQEAIPVPPALSAGLEGYLRARRGQQVDRQDFAAFYNDLAKRNNYPGGTPESLNAYIKQFNETGAIGPVAPAKQDIGSFQQGYNWSAQTPPGTLALHGVNASAAGIPELLGGQAVTNGLRELSSLNPKSALAGDVIGGVAGTAAAGRGLNLAGLSAPKALTLANLGNSTLFGAAESPENRVAGGAIGFGAGALGDAVGGYIAAPAVEALARKPVNMALTALKRPTLPIAPALSRPERTIINTVGDKGRAVTSMLGDASSLGLPMTLADTTEGLRSLSGAVARRSPEARDMARNVMEPRSLGQIDRLQGALNRDIGPTANIPQRSEDLIQQARTNAGPLYEEAYAAPGASSIDLADIRTRPSFQAALNRAHRIAMEEGRDPRALGFDFDAEGNTVLTRTDPSFQTLDYVKRGMDDHLEQFRNPLTGQMHLDESGRAINATRADMLGRIDEVNPTYAEARQAYAGPASERSTMQMGQTAINQPADQIGVTLNGLTPPRQEQYRLGALSALSQKANNARFGTNPYEAIYGSPEAQRRVATLFPDANLGRFGRQVDLERQMAQSRNQILGGSPTALNQRADQTFDIPFGATLAIDGASAMLAGAPPLATGTRLLGNLSKDSLKVGFGTKRANELAPLLFSPDAATAAAAFEELSKNARRSKVFDKAAKRRRGIFGGVTGGAVGAGATSERQ